MVKVIITKEDLIELAAEKLEVDAEYFEVETDCSLSVKLDIDEIKYKQV